MTDGVIIASAFFITAALSGFVYEFIRPNDNSNSTMWQMQGGVLGAAIACVAIVLKHFL